MKILILFVFILSVNVFGFVIPQELVSAAKLDSLKKEADAVVLLDKFVFTVDSQTDAELFHKKRVLIKNKHALKYCRFYFWGSKFKEVTDIEAKLTDTNGQLIKELDDDDIEEFAYTPGYALYEDKTKKYFELTSKSFPFIIEYSYRIEYETLFFWPGWYPQNDIPVVSSSYKLICDTDISYKTKTIGLNITPKRIKVKGDSVITWSARNIPPVKEEPWSPPESELQNAIIFAPINFELGDSQGSFSDWNSIAKWYGELAKGRYELPLETKDNIQQLISEMSDEKEIINTLYKYMQDKTRYVSISLGIGGWQPHSAESSYTNRYGDCKDLSTLMISMLDVADIKAYPALALTRDAGMVDADFPSNQFNHCIAFVPLAQDTVWLECTADFIDPEDVPYKIEAINALVVKENGGELIRTPQKSARLNKWQSVVEGSLDKRGGLTFKSIVDLTGNQKNSFRGFTNVSKPEVEKKVVLYQHNKFINIVQIYDYSFIETEAANNPYRMVAEGKFKRFAKSTANMIFFNPNIFKRETKDDIPLAKTRSFPIKLLYPYVDSDSLAIKIPRGYKLESAPEAITLNTPFAKYKTQFEVKNGFFYFKRYIEYSKNLIQPEFYDKYIDFITKVVKSDQSKFVFKKG
jgi:transglutaminase-like putative cysteine protease